MLLFEKKKGLGLKKGASVRRERGCDVEMHCSAHTMETQRQAAKKRDRVRKKEERERKGIIRIRIRI